MVTGIQYEIPTWSQIYDMLLCQAQKIRGVYYADVVVGVARGGLVSARILADLLEVPQLCVVQVEFYVDVARTKAEPTLRQPLTVALGGKRVLLVDDIADSGASLKLAVSHLQTLGAAEVKTATLYYKPQSAVKPDFYEKQTQCWVIFPWDVKETLRMVLQRQTGRRQANGEIAKIVKAGLPKQLADRLLDEMR